MQWRVKPSPHSYLKQQFPVRSGVSEGGSVVVFIQDSDVSRASGAAGGCTPVLNHHNKLVA